jgi:hypothetical protein
VKKLSRLVVAAAFVGLATVSTPAQATHDCDTHPCYECVMYPCYPSDWVEFLSGGTLSIDDHIVCVDGVLCV